MSALLTVTTLELMRLWGELVEAYHGVHGYGSTVAEVYAYRLMPYTPTAHMEGGEAFRATEMHQEAVSQVQRNAGMALKELCEQFAESYECEVAIDGRTPQMWWTYGGGDQFRSRAYVQVQHHEEPHL